MCVLLHTISTLVAGQVPKLKRNMFDRGGRTLCHNLVEEFCITRWHNFDTPSSYPSYFCTVIYSFFQCKKVLKFQRLMFDFFPTYCICHNLFLLFLHGVSEAGGRTAPKFVMQRWIWRAHVRVAHNVICQTARVFPVTAKACRPASVSCCSRKVVDFLSILPPFPSYQNS